MTNADTSANHRHSFSELLRRPGVIEVLDIRSTFGFLAFHGGNLERLTDQIASEAAARSGASFYGVLQPTGMRHHISSKYVNPDQAPQLAKFLDHCDVVIAIHGYGLQGRWADVLVGGGNRDLAVHVGSHLRDQLPAYKVLDRLEDIPTRLRGQHADNPCNLSSGGGVQIELPPRVRGLSPLARYWPTRHEGTKRFAHTEHLIEGLAEAARSWSD
jgi:phage replication-related protein YjqB (UPF0714/DUF867 family)